MLPLWLGVVPRWREYAEKHRSSVLVSRNACVMIQARERRPLFNAAFSRQHMKATTILIYLTLNTNTGLVEILLLMEFLFLFTFLLHFSSRFFVFGFCSGYTSVVANGTVAGERRPCAGCEGQHTNKSNGGDWAALFH